MLQMGIPNSATLRPEHLVLDYNGTRVLDGPIGVLHQQPAEDAAHLAPMPCRHDLRAPVHQPAVLLLALSISSR